MVHVLFVCLGNICRSPMAEAIFKDMVNQEGLGNKIQIDSAGTAGWHTGKIPHEGTRKLLDEKQISYEGLKARQFNQEDLDQFTYIITMDDQNMKDLAAEFHIDSSDVVVKRLMDFVEEPEEENVPDPYFTGDFNYTYTLISTGLNKVLNHIKTNHNL